MFFIIIPLFLIYIPLSSGFLFGNAGGVGGCSCSQPICQPSLPPCPLPSSAPISNNGAHPIIVNCAGNVGGSGCVSGSAADRSEDAIPGPKLAEHAINVVLVSQHGGNDKNCIDNPVNKGEGKCGDEQQSINLVLDGNEGEPHKGESAGEYANKPAGCNDETRPCDIRIEHEQMQGKSNVWQPQQYASANNGQDYTAQLQQQSGGYAQKQSANIGYAQKGVDYASQRPPSIGYTSQLHRSGEYNAQLQQSVQPEPDQYQRKPILPSEPQSPGSYLSESGPAEQSYQQPTSEVQPAASESESSYSGSENAAAAAAGDRLQEVQEDTIESSTKEINNSTVTFMPHSSITSSTVSVVTTAENFQIETSTQQLHAGQQHKSSNEQHDVFIEPVDISLLKLTNDTECNNDELRTIIKKNLPYELNIAKRQIQLQAEARFGGRFDVICSHHDFSYITNTELWCQETRESTSCYAYRQLGY